VGEKESEPFQFTFNGFLKVAFQGSRVTSDAGLILVRELDERLGLEAILTEHLSDSRHGLNTQFPLPDLLRQSIYSRLAGYEDLNDALETRGVQYAIRIPANKNLELAIEDMLFRSPGRPSLKPLVRYKSFQYQADSWTTARRVVAKVEHHVGELFPRVGFIVTNLWLPNRAVVRFYNKRGTAEQWIKEGKQAAHWTRLSCHRFRANEVRLQLSVLAYNLGNLWRRLVLPARIDTWSLTSLQQRLVKTGGRLVKHARYYWLLLAESHLTRRLFGAMLRRIWALPVPMG